MISVNINNKRSQAAMEFLLTYGWALVVVVVAISSMAYFGVLDGTGLAAMFKPDMCQMPPEISCVDQQLYYDPDPVFGNHNDLYLYLMNNRGFDVEMNKIEVGDDEEDFGDPGYPLTSQPEKIEVIRIFSSDPLEADGSYELELKITYTNAETGLTHTNVGSIRGKQVLFLDNPVGS